MSTGMMEDYTLSSERASKVVTQTFSTSFSSAISLFSPNIQHDIYNIYGLVRVADEIVDTYQGKDARKMLDALEQEVYATLVRGFSSNVIVHAYAETARKFLIDDTLIAPFFESMRMDLTKKKYNQDEYKTYIYGSAEVVGLMCLKVFVQGKARQYNALKPGASALGSAFQKVNFLRDIKDDYESRGRYYFPEGSFKTFNDSVKQAIIADIENDFAKAKKSIDKLPTNAKFATALAYKYYLQLLKVLKNTPAQEIVQNRVSVGRFTKLRLLVTTKIASYVQ
jgi:15-cis-phytoene synthase